MTFPDAENKWKKHAADFPELANLADYIDEAERLAHYRRTRGDILVTMRKRDSARLVYERSTNMIVFVNSADEIMSLFRPSDGEEYFRRELRRQSR